ncbi:MAG: T9SS type A sorting domain-containing protein, partial [Candidatus Neomarinimicrobiota bacterium]
VSGDVYYVSIRATDGAGNVSNIATSNGITIDAINPVVTDVAEGDISFDQDYQQSSSSLVISWGGSDDLRTFRNNRELSNYEVSIGTAPGEINVVDWINVGNVNIYEFTGLNLQESITYYANVKALDQAGNESNVVSGDGITIDQSGPNTGTVNDGDSSDVDWVNVNFLSSGNWNGFIDELSGIQEYEYSLGLSPGQTQVVTWTSAGAENNITVSAALTEGPTYYANLRAIDSVQNVSEVISSDGFGLDQSSPVAGSVNDGIGDDITWTNNDGSIQANWSGFSDEYSGIRQYDYSIKSSDDNVSWQEVTPWASSETETYLDQIIELDHGTKYRVDVRAVDLVDNVSVEVFSDGVTIDTLNPVLAFLHEAEEGDPIYQGSDSSVALFWDGSDDLSGIMAYEVALGTSPGDSDLVSWTNVGMSMSTDLMDLMLEDESSYYGSVRTKDLAGNVAELNGNGVIVDTTPPEIGLVLDGLESDNEYQSTEGIEVSWSNFNDQGSGIAEYLYSLGTEENPTSVINNVSSGLEESMTLTGLSLEHGSRYVFSVKAVDIVGNISAIAMSDGFTVDEYVGPPEIMGLSLDTLSSLIALTSNTELIISLSEPLQSYEIALQAGVESGYGMSEVYTENPPQLVVAFEQPFASYDTLTLSLTNLVDIAGIQGGDRELKFATALLGDYNLDMAVNVADLANFISAWNSDDYSLELGPTTGEVPNLVPTINGVLDLRDIMAFTRMWHWSHQTGGAALLAYEPIGSDPDISQDGGTVTLELPPEAVAANLQVTYPSGGETLALDNNFDPQRLLQLAHHEKEIGTLTVDRAFMYEEDGKTISFVVSAMDRENIRVELSYEVYGEDSRLIMSGRRTVEVLAVPDEFALHQNYPNPFNPVTQINYDLPQEGLVRMVIYDVMGREVKELVNQSMNEGYQTVRWDGTNSRGMNVSAGLYFCSLSTGSFNKTMKLLLLK